ncbi:adenosylcobinamide-GDP ribazoletransferase [Aquimarina sp. 2201CG1-2-11]|uniref:adenosylcobinamide-GDP ribazoletransferase n=1 Tax=Aquimarina discodermiae TaxID=3231043 RepID=UPI003462D636
MLKKELHIFFTALMFFTRIPCPKWVDHQSEYLQLSAKYFSLVGIVVGSIGGIVFYGASFIFSTEISLLLSMFVTIYITGAFHEDGFADVCDGFGGGWTKDSILRIMKDSRLGTYGTIGLLFILAIKFAAIREMDPYFIPLLIISGHSLSRFIATTLLFTHLYVRDVESSKVKPTTKKISSWSLVISLILGCIPLLFFKNLWVFLVILPMYLSKVFLGIKFKKWIGGQTGDCAGAVQQLSEVIFYLSILALWKYIW